MYNQAIKFNLCSKPTSNDNYEHTVYEKHLNQIHDKHPKFANYEEVNKSISDIDSNEHNTSKWCSTKCNENYQFDQFPTLPEQPFRSEPHLNSIKLEKYRIASTLIRQQTKMLIKNGYLNKANSSIAIDKNRNYENYEEYDRQANKQVNNYNQMCSFCMINTIQDNSVTCRCNEVVYPLSIDSSNDYPSIRMYSSNDSTLSFNSESSFADSVNSDIPSIDPLKTDQDNILVCCHKYDSVNPGDLNLKFSQKVRVLYQSDSEKFILVQILGSGKCGYVPRQCLVTVNRFLSI